MWAITGEWRKEHRVMERWGMIFLVLIVATVLPLGCAGTQKDTKEMNDRMIRCPKCGAYFSTKEGADTFRYTLSPPNP